MPVSAETSAVLAALPEPAILVTVDGRIDHANKPALKGLGRSIVGSSLVELAGDPRALRMLLVRASGSREPLPGSLTPRPETGLARHRLHASLVRPGADETPALLLVRLSPIEDTRFAALGDKIRELNAEIRRRKSTQGILEESLSERGLLLRELHHRVKNNMQMLAGMLMSAQRETSGAEAKAVLLDATRRVIAVGAVQQMLYGSENLSGVPAQEYLSAITSTIAQASGAGPVALEVNADPGELANDLAVPVALIVNELLTNALKYGRPHEGEQHVAISLRDAGDGYVLTVEDNGPGFEFAETRKRASGLGLVRGLVRQLGGSLSFERPRGACVRIAFPNRSRSADVSLAS